MRWRILVQVVACRTTKRNRIPCCAHQLAGTRMTEIVLISDPTKRGENIDRLICRGGGMAKKASEKIGHWR